MSLYLRACLTALTLSGPALAEQSAGLPADLALPFNLGGAYMLVDQSGAPRSQADPDAKPQLLFFGYANCREICSAALPMMAQIVDELDRKEIAITPVMITVDPTRDTVATLGPALHQHHANFIGLTGTAQELQRAYDAFQIEVEQVFYDPEYGPVFAHGSFLYLLDAQGKFLTLLPPIITPEAAAGIVAKYIKGST